jgi:purine-nucleoside phosphorylase
MLDLNYKYKNLIKEIEKQKPFTPELAIILGSGLGDFADQVDTKLSIPTNSLPDYPKSTVEGHKGFIHFSEYQGKKLLLYQGRIHFYEGYSIDQCILPVFIAKKLKCKNLLLTNAAGGINPLFKPGDLMIINSFLSINIKKEITQLLRLTSIEQKNQFLNFPSDEINQIIREAGLEANVFLREGNYWYSKGPYYETPAEVKMIGGAGGDAVGMSTAHEAIMGAYLGMNVGAISCITNYAAGITDQKLSHDDVKQTAERVKEKFAELVKNIILRF